MLSHPNINPIAFSFSYIKVYWYGILYLVGFVSAWLISLKRCQQVYNSPISKSQVPDLIFYASIGVVVGGRLGYLLFYDLENFIFQPWLIFKVWNGGIHGMSFHGGLMGLMLTVGLFSQKNKCNISDVFDFIAPMAPIGLGLGRLGNFINGELWGRVTDLPIGMIFPSGGPLPRYPSQLLETILEGPFLWVILWSSLRRKRVRLFISAKFILWYGVFRFIAEIFRQPDFQIGYFCFNTITIGQIFSVPMIVIGLSILKYISRS